MSGQTSSLLVEFRFQREQGKIQMHAVWNHSYGKACEGITGTRFIGLRRPGRALLRHTCQKHKERALQAEKRRDKVPKARNRKVATMAEDNKHKGTPGEGLVKMSMAATW